MSATARTEPGTHSRGMRGVLGIPAFRRLWLALSLASLGDWLGLLALTAMAQSLSGGGYAAANLAVAGVFMLRLLPAIVLGPFAGVVADRLDRRRTMVVSNLFRGAVLASVPLVGRFWWLFVATFLLESASMFFLPAKEAAVPNLVGREQLETANQLNLLGTYGTAPVAAGIFAGLSLFNGILDNLVPSFQGNPVAIAVWFNAATFVCAGLLIAGVKGISARSASAPSEERILRTVVEGWRFIGGTPMVRGLVVGMLGAFAAGGAVIGLARTYVRDLGAGDPGYGLLFGVVFLGLAIGLAFGPRLFRGLSRRRLFGLSVVMAGSTLALLALIPNMVIAVLLTLTIGAWAGVGWVTGYTLLGLEVSDDVRGRTFAFVQTMVRITLVVVLALAPLIAAALGQHTLHLGDVMVTYNGAALTFLPAALLATVVGVASFRQMDDRPGVPLWADLLAVLRHAAAPEAPGHATGVFVALEGGEGAGKSTQARRLAELLSSDGHEVVVTREPGGTPLGARLREVLLDSASGAMSSRAEALLYAADRAEHVASVVRPALDRGAVVISDRYVDSSIAYQGAGRNLPPPELQRLSRWATGGLVPDLTVVLDLPPDVGLSRTEGSPDRLESEPLQFHLRVREEFLGLAGRQPDRYLVVDATLDPAEITALVHSRLENIVTLAFSEETALADRRYDQAEREARWEAERKAALARRRQAREASKAAQREAAKRVAEKQARRRAEQEALKRAETEIRRSAETESRQQEEARARHRAEAEARSRVAAEGSRRATVRGEQPGGAHDVVSRAGVVPGRGRHEARPPQSQSLADELFAWSGDGDPAEPGRHDGR